MNHSRILTGLALSSALGLTACGGGSGGTGTASFGVTDAAVDGATHVYVQFTGVEIKPKGGTAITLNLPGSQPRTIDLLALNGGGSTTLVQGVNVPAGDYEYVRLLVNAGQTGSDSSIVLTDGSTHPLYIPSGNQTGLKLVSGFSVPDGGFANFIIDFDLRKSITAPPGQNGTYILKPALRITNSDAVGQISGTVSATTIGGTASDGTACVPAVYVYAGANYTPGDEGSATAPLTSAAVKLDSTTGNYTYTAAFLPLGSYTAAFTCDAALDVADTDETDSVNGTPAGATVRFTTTTGSTDIAVTTGATTTVDFP